MSANLKFAVGAKVRLRKDSQYISQSGKTNLGTVSRHRPSVLQYYYRVEWEGRHGDNCYREIDLMGTSVVYDEDYLKDKDVL